MPGNSPAHFLAIAAARTARQKVFATIDRHMREIPILVPCGKGWGVRLLSDHRFVRLMTILDSVDEGERWESYFSWLAPTTEVRDLYRRIVGPDDLGGTAIEGVQKMLGLPSMEQLLFRIGLGARNVPFDLETVVKVGRDEHFSPFVRGLVVLSFLSSCDPDIWDGLLNTTSSDVTGLDLRRRITDGYVAWACGESAKAYDSWRWSGATKRGMVSDVEGVIPDDSLIESICWATVGKAVVESRHSGWFELLAAALSEELFVGEVSSRAKELANDIARHLPYDD